MNIIIKRFLTTIVSTIFAIFLISNTVPETHIGLLRWVHIETLRSLDKVIGYYLLIAIVLQPIIWMYYYRIRGIVLEQNTFLRIHNTYGILIMIAISLWIITTIENDKKRHEKEKQDRERGGN